MVVSRVDSERMTKPIEAGMVPAVCYGVVELGEHVNKFDPSKTQRKVLIMWEIGEKATNAEGKEYNRSISKEFAVSLHEKATLCKTLENWRGKKFTAEETTQFNLDNLLELPCTLNITHTEREGKTYANIETVNPPMKGIPPLVRTNDIISFDLKKETLGEIVNLPKFIQDKITTSITYRQLTKSKLDTSNMEAINDDGLPF